MARMPLIAGNWKMNLNYLEAIHLVESLATELDDRKFDFSQTEVVVIPPFVDIRSVTTVLQFDKSKIQVGAQDVSVHESGAYTGEISAGMLRKLGCTYVLVGHSERREYHGETDTLVGDKGLAALGRDLTPIICVGEPAQVRRAGQHVEHVVAQVKGALVKYSAEQTAQVTFAYEPVWAIGTGEVATPRDAEEVCAEIRAVLRDLYGEEIAATVRILYGGSVKSSNIREIMAEPNVDGVLVGGASLQANEFAKICDYRG